jgi:murein L,D-transpeptidase YafK
MHYFTFIVALMISVLGYCQDNLQTIIRKIGIAKGDLEILIHKSSRKLEVYHDDSLLITYDCVLGFNPVDDKHMEGDGCTPEGEFKIRSMYAHSSWKYFIWIDYPNQDSWAKFKRRKSEGEIPSSATIGGEIGIHGVPNDSDSLIDEGIDWTLGCISLRNDDVTDLYKCINKSTIIHIQP